MAFKDFSDTQYIKTIDSGEVISMGGFKPANNTELKYMRVIIVFSDYTVTNETAQLDIYSEDQPPSGVTAGNLLFSSGVADLSLVDGLTNNWIGFLTFTFDRQALSNQRYYYPVFKVNNYVRTADSYIGLSLDMPFPIYDNGETSIANKQLAAALFGYER